MGDDEQFPPMNAEFEGYAWLPRMFEKARGTLAGDDRPDFGCPVDHTCMANIGIHPELVLELVERHESDAEILAALRAHGIPGPEEAWFDGQAVEDEIQGVGYIRVRDRDQLPEANGGRAFHGGEHGAPVSVLLLDSGPGEVQPPHSHGRPEVIAVTEGEATLHLGDAQARILRAGQVARIPAGMTHSLVNRGEERFRAVAAQGADEIDLAGP